VFDSESDTSELTKKIAESRKTLPKKQ
jgi:hypothetical protein